MPDRQQQVRVADVLAMAEALYRRLESKVHLLEDHRQGAEVLALLQFVEQRTHLVGETLRTAQQADDNRALQSWLMYHPEFTATDAFERLEIHDGISAEELMAAVLSMEDCLLKLFRETESLAESGPARELFTNLASIQESGRIEMIAAAVRGYY